jgi:hypothetical protein
MGIGYEIWHMECMKLERVWNMDNNILVLKRIGLRSLDLVKTWTGCGFLTHVVEILGLKMEIRE